MNILNDEFDLLTYKPARTFKMNGGLALTRMLNTELGITAYADYHHLKPIFTYIIAEDLEEPNLEPSAVETFKEKNNMNYVTAGLKLTAFF